MFSNLVLYYDARNLFKNKLQKTMKKHVGKESKKKPPNKVGTTAQYRASWGGIHLPLETLCPHLGDVNPSKSITAHYTHSSPPPPPPPPPKLLSTYFCSPLGISLNEPLQYFHGLPSLHLLPFFSTMPCGVYYVGWQVSNIHHVEFFLKVYAI